MCTRLLVSGIAFQLILIGGQAAGSTVYVAPNGDDSASGGTRQESFESFARVVDEIAELRAAVPEGAVRVLAAPGTYVLKTPLTLGEAHGGTMDAQVSIEGEKGARLLGGRTVSGFEKVGDEATLARLDASARGEVYRVNLKALGITDYGAASGAGLELFFDGKPMQIARWPNEGFVKIVDVLEGEPVKVHGREGIKEGRWTYEGERPARWLDESDGWLYGYWFWDWSAQHQRIKSIDPDAKSIEVEEPYHGYGFRKGQWYYALNLLSEIDMPGEWYLDRETGDLFFWPPSPIEESETFVSLLKNAVVLDDMSHTTVRGFVIEGVRETAVRVTGGTGNLIADCIIRNSGGDAMSISDGEGHGVRGCEIYAVGGGGISIGGGARESLRPAGHFAENNRIHDYARWYRMYHPGISLRGVGHRVAHNAIYDAPHMAIQFGGNDHVIEYNEIYNVCYESNDAGAIYAGRDWTERGTVIRYNFMHHVTGFEDRGCVGVYLDDMFSGTRIYGNLFYKVYRAAFIGGGRDNVYENNLFVDCPKALHIDNRAQNWADYHVDTTMTERLNAMPFLDAPWRDRYPELLTILEDEPAAPKGNRIVRNVFVGEDWDDVSDGARGYVSFEGNVFSGEPGFAHPERIRDGGELRATDFALREDAAALGSGFVALPLERMGVE